MGTWARQIQHGDVHGAYSYWSVRSAARPVNKGLRLDYFVCSAPLCHGMSGDGDPASTEGKGSSGAVRAHDTYILHDATVGVSDHAPVGLVLALSH